jgi:hypothetical protein
MKIIFFLAIIGCSAEPKSFNIHELDSGDETNNNSDAVIEHDTGTDVDTDVDTGTDVDFDTDFCPWECRSTHETQPAYTCDEYSYPEEPSLVANFNFLCPLDHLCCQPWPPADDLGISDYCGDFELTECGENCDVIDPNKACYNAAASCCRLVKNGTN